MTAAIAQLLRSQPEKDTAAEQLERRKNGPLSATLAARGDGLPPDIVLKLPQYFFSMSFLASLAECSPALRQRAADPKIRLGLDIDVDDPEQGKMMSRLWRSRARTLTMEQSQLACLDAATFCKAFFPLVYGTHGILGTQVLRL